MFVWYFLILISLIRWILYFPSVSEKNKSKQVKKDGLMGDEAINRLFSN